MASASASIPHRELSFGILASMKLVDRRSCSISGLEPASISGKELLRSDVFGQFGPLSSVRILQQFDSCDDALVLYQNPESAAAAIEWCRDRGLSADHGYNKYCLYFITNRPCKRPQCNNRHSWCPEEDVLERKDKDTAVSPEEPRRSKWAESAHPVSDDTLFTLRSRCAAMQQKFLMQHKIIQSMVASVEALRHENKMLRAENLQHSHFKYLSSGSSLLDPSISTSTESTRSLTPAITVRSGDCEHSDDSGLGVEE